MKDESRQHVQGRSVLQAARCEAPPHLCSHSPMASARGAEPLAPSPLYLPPFPPLSPPTPPHLNPQTSHGLACRQTAVTPEPCSRPSGPTYSARDPAASGVPPVT